MPPPNIFLFVSSAFAQLSDREFQLAVSFHLFSIKVFVGQAFALEKNVIYWVRKNTAAMRVVYRWKIKPLYVTFYCSWKCACFGGMFVKFRDFFFQFPDPCSWCSLVDLS